MKVKFFLLLVVLTGAVIWQSLAIQDLREKGDASPHSREHADQRRSADSNDWRKTIDLPLEGASAAEHLSFLKQINQMTNHVERAQAIYDWTSGLKDAGALNNALAALRDSSLTEEERIVLTGRFGPGLFSRWGTIDPMGGFEAWDALGWSERRNFLGEDCSPHHKTELTYSFPFPLLEAWAGNDSAHLLEKLPELPTTYPKEVFSILSDSAPRKMFSYLDRFDQAEYRSNSQAFIPHDKTGKILRADFMPMSEGEKGSLKAHAINRISQSLSAENGSTAGALAAVKSFPDGDSRRALELGLLSRAIKDEGGSPEQFEEVLTKLPELPMWARSDYINKTVYTPNTIGSPVNPSLPVEFAIKATEIYIESFTKENRDKMSPLQRERFFNHYEAKIEGLRAKLAD